jgi:hypothetical protein
MTNNLMAGMSPTKVGNGDNGNDLEGFTRLTSGPIVEARDKAAERLKSMNVKSIRGLGQLLPEVEKTDLYITKKDITDHELHRLGAFEVDRKGNIYARTFARPHAATRFFPIAKTLGEDQLVALHIHEALHRTLPPHIREDERAVSDITLAIVSPDASLDQIEAKMLAYLPKPADSYSTASWSPQYKYLEGDQINRNFFDYEASAFSNDSDSALEDLSFTHKLSSRLYPFGGSMEGTGLGLSLSWININEKNEMGPLAVSLQHHLHTITRFKVFGFLEHSIAGSSEELSFSAFSRDVTRLGIRMYSFKNKNFNLINTFRYTLPSKAKDKTLNNTVDYSYGPQYNANIKLRGIYKSFGLGGFVDYAIATEREVTQGSFSTTEDRASVVSLGLEAGYFGENYSVFVSTKKLMNSSDINYDRFGDVDSVGAGDSNLQLGVSLLW